MSYKISHLEIQGSSHVSEEIPCQDKTAYVTFDNCACIALADGAGSRRFSHFGAEIATKAICDYFIQNSNLERYDSEEIINLVKANLLNSEYNFDDLASTLLFVFIRKNTAVIGHLGDGVIFGVGDHAEVISYPENGAQNNITYFTVDTNACEHFRIKKFDLSKYENYTFLLTSDGGESFLYNKVDSTPAKAVSTFANWLKDGKPDDVDSALYNNLNAIVTQFTPDDVSLIQIFVNHNDV
jgi:hypothetical protein